MLFEGNTLENIDPYLYLPDPSVASHEVQKGEYSGWIQRGNLMNLLAEEQSDEDMFNVRYLRSVMNKNGSQFAGDSSHRTEKTGVVRDPYNNTTTNPVDVISPIPGIVCNRTLLSSSLDIFFTFVSYSFIRISIFNNSLYKS